MILAAKYAREHQIPYLGLCLGMQVAIIEYARHVCGFNDAHSIELDPNTTHPVIALMPDQNGIEDIGGTLRLGSYPCILDKTPRHTRYTVLRRSMRDTDTVMRSTTTSALLSPRAA